MGKSFSDRLTPGQVQKCLDRLYYENLIPNWRESTITDGWVNMPNKHAFSDLSINIFHGGFVNQYESQMIDTYDSSQGIPPKGDFVKLVMYLKFGLNDDKKAIQWIKEASQIDTHRSTVHSLNVDDAIKYGAECALLLYNIRFWLDKNMANESERHINEGRVWTYNSAKAFAKLFPYLSENQIYRRIKKLEDEGILLIDHFHKDKWKRSNWYSINEPKYQIKSSQPISRNREMHSAESKNGLRKIG